MRLPPRLQRWLHQSGAPRPTAEFDASPRRPALPVASILRDLDEIFGLDLRTVGRIISSGNTIPHEEIYAHMLEWAQGFDSEFAESKYLPRLQALLDISQAMWLDPEWHEVLAQALVNPLPASADPQRRSIALLIQADDFEALERIERSLRHP